MAAKNYEILDFKVEDVTIKAKGDRPERTEKLGTLTVAGYKGRDFVMKLWGFRATGLQREIETTLQRTNPEVTLSALSAEDRRKAITDAFAIVSVDGEFHQEVNRKTGVSYLNFQPSEASVINGPAAELYRVRRLAKKTLDALDSSDATLEQREIMMKELLTGLAERRPARSITVTSTTQAFKERAKMLRQASEETPQVRDTPVGEQTSQAEAPRMRM